MYDCVLKEIVGEIDVTASQAELYGSQLCIDNSDPDKLYYVDSTGNVVRTNIRHNTYNRIF